ncbi:MAG: tetratricopeptide repeat protein [Deltaproteobacteria bacterium]|nr:tetratricopeptide repeat protein [Deltaproteobacteria bacterium]
MGLKDRAARHGLYPGRAIGRESIVLIRLGLLAFALIMGCNPSSGPNPDEQAANRMLVEGKLKEAIARYEKAMKTDRTPSLLNKLGLSHLLANEAHKAVKYLAEAKALEPAKVSTRRALALALAASGQTKQARNEASEIIRTNPELGAGQVLLAALVETPDQVEEALDALLKYQKNASWQSTSSWKVETDLALADLYERKGDLETAQAYLKRAQEAKTANPEGALELAVVYIRLLRFVAAERLLKNAVSSEPKYIPAWSRLAQIAVELNHFPLAEKALKKLPKEVLDNDEMVLIRGRVYLAQGKTREAVSLLRKRLSKLEAAGKTKDRTAVYRLFIAQGLSNSGDDQGARRELEKTISSPVVSAAARFALVEIDIRQKRYDNAMSRLKELILDPLAERRASEMLGKLLLDRRDAQAAIEFYSDRVNQYPRDAQLLHHLGSAYQMAGKTETAITLYKKSLALAPGSEAPLRALMTTAIAENKPKLAEKYLIEQLKLRPQSPALKTVAGKFYLQIGDMKKAGEAFKDAVKLDRTSAAAQVRLARFYLEIDQPTVALPHFNQALRIDPNHAFALQHAAQLEMTTGNPDRAKKHYTRLLELQPENAAALNNLAYLFADSRATIDMALGYATRARKIAPYSPHVADTLGWILFHKRSYQEALPLINHAAKALPKEASVAYHLGMIQLAMGNETQGVSWLRRALRLSSTFDGYNTAMLVVSMSLKNRELLLRYLNETFAPSPQPAKVRAIEADFFLSIGDAVMAEEALKAVLRHNSDDLESMLKLARIYLKSNRAILALPVLTRALEKQPDNPEILRQVAELEAEYGDKKLAIKRFLDLLKTDPDDQNAPRHLARLYASSSETLAQAEKYAEIAIKITPNDPQVKDTMGWILYQKREYEKALAMISSAARELTKNAETQYHLGMTQLALNQASGVRSLQKALALSPNFDGADKAREMLAKQAQRNKP